MRRRRPLLVSFAAAALPAALAPSGRPRAQGAAEPVTVFAAASLTDALRAQAEAWRARGNPAPRLSFAASSAPSPWPEQEVWSFEAAPSVRTVQIEGGAAIDARQAGVSPGQQSFPAWSVPRGGSLEAKWPHCREENKERK